MLYVISNQGENKTIAGKITGVDKNELLGW